MDQSNSDNNQTNSSAPNSNKEECSEKMDAALANYDEVESCSQKVEKFKFNGTGNL